MRACVLVFAAAMAILLTLPACGASERQAPVGQSDVGDIKAWEPRLTLDGQPDIQGIWQAQGPGGTSGLNIEVLPNGDAPPYKTNIVDPPSHIIPYQPWARLVRDEVRDNYLHPTAAQVDQRNRAWPDGVPRITLYRVNSFQVLQPPGQVVLYYEAQHEFRIIPLDNRPHPGTNVQLWLGDSRGRWEGRTLVVDVTNHNDRTRLSVVGDFHSDELRVTERWAFVDPNTIQFSATIEDPKVFTRPWTIGDTLKRNSDASFKILEYAGVEGERDAALMVDIPQSVADRAK